MLYSTTVLTATLLYQKDDVFLDIQGHVDPILCGWMSGFVAGLRVLYGGSEFVMGGGVYRVELPKKSARGIVETLKRVASHYPSDVSVIERHVLPLEIRSCNSRPSSNHASESR